MWKNIPLWILLFCTFLCWSAWALVLNKISPVESPRIAVPAFYFATFFSLLTTFTVIGSLLRKFSAPHRKILSCINISLRQGTILAVMCSVALFFQQQRIFTWWIGALLLTIAVTMEALFWQDQG